MQKIKLLFENEKKVIFTSLFSLLIFYLVFLISNLNMGMYFLCFELIIFFLLVYLVFSYFSLKKKIDISERYKNLERENERLVNEKIEFKNEILEYFFMWIHQIKTPITSAKLLLKREDTDRQEMKKQLFYIEDYTNMALSYLKITDKNADMDICLTDLDEVVRSVLRKYSVIFISNSVRLNYEKIEKKVVTDPNYLSLIIEQIISNAAKYARGKSVYIYFDKDKNSLVIKDTGMGILSEDLPRIFERGYSGFNGRLNQKSSGIGLFLVKKTAEKLSLDIKVESEIKKFTSFYIVFPKDKKF